MGNGESSPRSYGPQTSFSAGSYTERSNFNREHARVAFIPDNFSSLDQVISALRDYGLESSNLILGIDFTKSNEWTASTHDQCVFSFYPDHRSCRGFEEVLARYREIVPFIRLSGPTSFAPLIYASIDIVERSNWQYHVLVIIADGQVTRTSDIPHGSFSSQEHATIDAIVAASYYPLSIVMVGVGDGPWDVMQQFDDYIPQRSFDNFQFVNFTKIMSTNMEMEKKEAAFALAALMEIPFQYKATQSLRHIENRGIKQGSPSPLPPPREVIEHDNAKSMSRTAPAFHSTAYNAPSLPSIATDVSTSLPSAHTTSTEQACPICLTNPKDMAFGCGHLRYSCLELWGRRVMGYRNNVLDLVKSAIEMVYEVKRQIPPTSVQLSTRSRGSVMVS